ncbi:hypothetical protein RQP46_002946 [Phenoliferia psychrophenolica]
MEMEPAVEESTLDKLIGAVTGLDPLFVLYYLQGLRQEGLASSLPSDPHSSTQLTALEAAVVRPAPCSDPGDRREPKMRAFILRVLLLAGGSPHKHVPSASTAYERATILEDDVALAIFHEWEGRTGDEPSWKDARTAFAHAVDPPLETWIREKDLDRKYVQENDMTDDEIDAQLVRDTEAAALVESEEASRAIIKEEPEVTDVGERPAIKLEPDSQSGDVKMIEPERPAEPAVAENLPTNPTTLPPTTPPEVAFREVLSPIPIHPPAPLPSDIGPSVIVSNLSHKTSRFKLQEIFIANVGPVDSVAHNPDDGGDRESWAATVTFFAGGTRDLVKRALQLDRSLLMERHICVRDPTAATNEPVEPPISAATTQAKDEAPVASRTRPTAKDFIDDLPTTNSPLQPKSTIPATQPSPLPELSPLLAQFFKKASSDRAVSPPTTPDPPPRRVLPPPSLFMCNLPRNLSEETIVKRLAGVLEAELPRRDILDISLRRHGEGGAHYAFVTLDPAVELDPLIRALNYRRPFETEVGFDAGWVGVRKYVPGGTGVVRFYGTEVEEKKVVDRWAPPAEDDRRARNDSLTSHYEPARAPLPEDRRRRASHSPEPYKWRRPVDQGWGGRTRPNSPRPALPPRPTPRYDDRFAPTPNSKTDRYAPDDRPRDNRYSRISPPPRTDTPRFALRPDERSFREPAATTLSQPAQSIASSNAHRPDPIASSNENRSTRAQRQSLSPSPETERRGQRRSRSLSPHAARAQERENGRKSRPASPKPSLDPVPAPAVATLGQAQAWISSPKSSTVAPPKVQLTAQERAEEARLAALPLLASDLALIRSICNPVPTPPHSAYSRQASLTTTFGWVPPAIASRALVLGAAPFPNNAMQLQYESFLAAQSGESMDHYARVLVQVQTHNDMIEKFQKIAKETAERAVAEREEMETARIQSEMMEVDEVGVRRTLGEARREVLVFEFVGPARRAFGVGGDA